MDDPRAAGFDGLMTRLVAVERGRIDELVVPRLPVVVVHGHGSPGDAEFRTAVRDLYAAAFAVKMLSRTGGASVDHHDFTMAPMQAIFDSLGRTGRWRILFPMPAFVTPTVLATARSGLGDRVGTSDVVLEHLDEGLCLQTLHVGPFTTELASVQALRDFAASRGHVLDEHHHEIYLDDPQKVAQDAMRTVIRYPVRTAR